jgi:hypothetical protein
MVSLIRSRCSTFKLRVIFLLLFVLILSTLACQIDLGGPERPGELIPYPTNTAQDVTEIWRSAIDSALSSGQVTVLITENQLSSFIAARFEDNDQTFLREPQVFLRANTIQIYGLAERGIFKASVLFAIEPQVDTDGSLSFELNRAEFGPFPAPEALKDTLSSLLTEALTGRFGSLATGVRVISIAIDNGEMAIVGALR